MMPGVPAALTNAAMGGLPDITRLRQAPAAAATPTHMQPRGAGLRQAGIMSTRPDKATPRGMSAFTEPHLRIITTNEVTGLVQDTDC